LEDWQTETTEIQTDQEVKKPRSHNYRQAETSETQIKPFSSLALQLEVSKALKLSSKHQNYSKTDNQPRLTKQHRNNNQNFSSNHQTITDSFYCFQTLLLFFTGPPIHALS
jgi:hypothetical protein